jgi:hypothetical protein
MYYQDLVFQEISEHEVQAAYPLHCGYKVQIILNILDGTHECNLYDSQGNIVDSVEDEDERGVNFFIGISDALIKDIEFFEEAMNENCELVQTGE